MKRPDVEKYEAMAEAATVGPWGYDGQHDEITSDNPNAPDYWLIVSQCRTAPDEAPVDEFGHQYSPDLALMAAARTAVPELCAYIRELEGMLRARADERRGYNPPPTDATPPDKPPPPPPPKTADSTGMIGH